MSIPASAEAATAATINLPSGSAAPIAARERIASLDVLRGVVLLGILPMNIQAFSMISAAYVNPTAYGDFHGARICAVPYVTPRSQERRSSATPLLNSEPFSTSNPALRMRVRPGLD